MIMLYRYETGSEREAGEEPNGVGATLEGAGTLASLIAARWPQQYQRDSPRLNSAGRHDIQADCRSLRDTTARPRSVVFVGVKADNGDMHFARWLKSTILVFGVMFTILFVAGWVRERPLDRVIKESVGWSAISTSLFMGSMYFGPRRNSCAMCRYITGVGEDAKRRDRT